MAWEIDPAHSYARFSVYHVTAGPVRGRFGAIRGYLHVDDENPLHSWVDAAIDAASVDAASIDTGSDARDARLRSADFLDAAGYPALTFKSVRLEHIAGQKYKVSGELTLHGVTRMVTCDAEFHEEGGVNGAHRAALIARTKITSADFGLARGMSPAEGERQADEIVAVDLDLTLASKASMHHSHAAREEG